MSQGITLIALAGRAGAGKDTAAGMLRDPIWETHPDACIVITGFASRLKRALEVIFGLNFCDLTREQKERRLDWLGKSPRELMQTLGTEWGRSIHPELWILLLEREVYDHPKRYPEVYIITDCRFPNEIAWVRAKGGVVWWVERAGMPRVAAHSSETAIGPMDCDLTIPNFGTMDDLAARVRLAWAQHVAAMEVQA
jgi:hypothetical protein